MSKVVVLVLEVSEASLRQVRAGPQYLRTSWDCAQNQV